MSNKSTNSTGGLWLFLLLLAGLYLYIRFLEVPTLKGNPTLVSVETLLTHPEAYQNQLVMLTDGLVFDSKFFLERCVFKITDRQRSGTLGATSARYHPNGSKLQDAVFVCEILYCDQEQTMLLLREVQRD